MITSSPCSLRLPPANPRVVGRKEGTGVQADFKAQQFGYRPASDLLAVGWLAAGHEFPTGETPVELHEKLAWLCVSASVERTRGFHLCEFCPRTKDFPTHSVRVHSPEPRKHLLGTAEIHVTDGAQS